MHAFSVVAEYVLDVQQKHKRGGGNKTIARFHKKEYDELGPEFGLARQADASDAVRTDLFPHYI